MPAANIKQVKGKHCSPYIYKQPSRQTAMYLVHVTPPLDTAY